MTWKDAAAQTAVDLAYQLHEQGQTEAGVRVLDTYLAEERTNPWVAATAGNLLRMAGSLERAVDYFGKALAVQPDAAYTLGLRGDCNSELGLPRTALADYERAIYLGVSNNERLAEWCDVAARIYAFLDEEAPNVLFAHKAGLYEARASLLLAATGTLTASPMSTWRQCVLDAHWIPGERFAGMTLGGVLDRAVLDELWLRPSPFCEWAPFDRSLGVALYTEGDLLDVVKVTRSLKLRGEELIALRLDDLRALLGEPSRHGVERGDPFVNYPDIGAMFLFKDEKVVEALLSGSIDEEE